MGGPQNPRSSKEELPHFDAQAEITLIQKCIQAGKAVLGVCLGSQLIGEALNENFEHSPEKEIGVFPIQLTDEGLQGISGCPFGIFIEFGTRDPFDPYGTLLPECIKGSPIFE